MLKFEPNFDPGQLIFRSVPIGFKWRPIFGLKMGTRGSRAAPPIEKLERPPQGLSIQTPDGA